MKLIYLAISLIMILVVTTSCKEDDTATLAKYPLTIQFEHVYNSEELSLNEKKYTNAAGNLQSVEKLQYIISDIQLYANDKVKYLVDAYHFVDLQDSKTLIFDPGIMIEEGNYTGLSFVYGLKKDKNKDGAYVDLNVLSWSWPSMLGGGYHFMKLEGKFKNATGMDVGYATHMGTAREILEGTASKFHENYIDIDFSKQGFTVRDATTIKLTMDIKKWYESPFTWDLNTFGMKIMPNYTAQINLRKNGKDVWSSEIMATEK